MWSATYPRGSREAPSEGLTLFPISRAKKDRKHPLLNRKPRPQTAGVGRALINLAGLSQGNIQGSIRGGIACHILCLDWTGNFPTRHWLRRIFSLTQFHSVGKLTGCLCSNFSTSGQTSPDCFHFLGHNIISFSLGETLGRGLSLSSLRLCTLTLKSLGNTSAGCPRTTNRREFSFLKLVSKSSRDWSKNLQSPQRPC